MLERYLKLTVEKAIEFSPFKQNWQATIEYLLDLETDLNREYRRRI